MEAQPGAGAGRPGTVRLTGPPESAAVTCHASSATRAVTAFLKRAGVQCAHPPRSGFAGADRGLGVQRQPVSRGMSFHSVCSPSPVSRVRDPHSQGAAPDGNRLEGSAPCPPPATQVRPLRPEHTAGPAFPFGPTLSSSARGVGVAISALVCQWPRGLPSWDSARSTVLCFA